MDFPQFIPQVGNADVDTIFVPASDQEPIKLLHHAMAVFRAVENGVSMVRATRWGISTAVDPLGRILAMMDDFQAVQKAMVVQIPMAGVGTLYARIGDLFAWLCVIGLLGMVAWALLFIQ